MILVSCKKDAQHMEKGTRFIQKNAAPGFGSGDENSQAIILTLYPRGEANLIPGGDVGFASKYKIRGKKITVEILPPNEPLKLRFTVVSEKELRGEKGQILRLDE
ncbi:hypothetical protein DBR43_21430 [Pedobacter sp. KBW06]|nr:hypothetical protein DBR43_21430 [Pedobacter sp. KBW06]